VIIPRARTGVSYPEMVALAGGEPVPVVCHRCGRLSSFQGRGARARDPRPKDQMGHPVLAVEPDRRGAYTRAELKALTDVLVRHPHVWVMTDDMYEHLVYDDFQFTTRRAGRAQTVRPQRLTVKRACRRPIA